MHRCDTKNRSWPFRGTAGILLVAVFWPLNWTLSGPRSSWGFFPLWLGYCLVVDSLVFCRKGSSMISRSLKNYAILFAISAPAWWLFELLNLRSGNWTYQGRELFSNFHYAMFASLSFSTVMPAVFGTAELVGTFTPAARISDDMRRNQRNRMLVPAFVAGFVSLLCFFLWPLYCFPLLWISIFLIVDPINGWTGKRSLIMEIVNEKWNTVISLGLGSLICGLFWEMWNFYSYPKWIYHIPFVDVFRVFEMPLAGYLGYLPFACELMAIYILVAGVFRNGKEMRFVQI